MLCLVPRPTENDHLDEIGRIIGARLSRLARERGLTRGQVHYMAGGDEIVSSATVNALLRGSIANPGIGTVLAIAKGLDLSLDQVLGLTPLPQVQAAPAPPAGGLEAVVERVDRLEKLLSQALLKTAEDRESVAEALEQASDKSKPKRANGPQPKGGRRAR